ncbi:hypothetical protein [Candidatus Palauibacter polyketidifaciens]|uniref:hypothetical protein n=1 Tax=Candidatus Palauibacter polyketidifaciens TaxID=3056740 RepID=UPI00239DC8EF|nr:hypothetical protein [Candidatus Palauibacter polyketidifaciens]MDE2719612.1 hypothetical protein [Candidatus Palauibacter polyketidifaciens]
MPPTRPQAFADRRRERERSGRRTLAMGLLASVLLHILLLVAVGGVRVDSLPFTLPPIETVPAPDALVVVEIAPTLPEDLPEEPRPEPVPPPEVEPPQVEPEPEEEEEEPEEEQETVEEGDPLQRAPGLIVTGAPTAPEAPRGLTNASRLRLRFSDRRLWFDPQSPRLIGERLVQFARADSAVRAILRDWLDSLQLEDDVRRRARDWTFERDGKRWGFSEQGIHLGDVTIPIPIGFAPTGPQRRAYEQAIRDLTAIQIQNLRDDVEAAAAEARARMRERSEEEVRRRGDTLRIRGPP